MADMITPNFSVSKMAYRCNGKVDMDPEFMRMLKELRNEVGPSKSVPDSAIPDSGSNAT